MTIIGVVTNNGLSQSITAQSNNGWFVALSKFEVSEISVGSRLSLTTSRTRSTIDETLSGPVFYTAPISSKIAQSPQLLQVNCTIPPHQNSDIVTSVTEIYVFGESPQFDVPDSDIHINTHPTAPNTIDLPIEFVSMLVDANTIIFKANGGSTLGTGLVYDDPNAVVPVNGVYYIKKINSTRIALYSNESLTTQVVFTGVGSGTHKICMEYLFAVGQPSTPIQYDPSGAVILRMLFNLQNIDVNTVFQFPYTQATEIYDHNLDPNAHPEMQVAMNEAGAYVVGGSATFEYKGQSFLRKVLANFHSSVTSPVLNPTIKKPVYYDTVSSLYKLAQATTGDLGKVVGFYFPSDNSIRTGGTVFINHSFAVNSIVYLSSSLAGELTLTPTTVKLGMSLGNGLLLLSGAGGGIETSSITELSDVTIASPLNNQILTYDATLGEWVNTTLTQVQGNTIINTTQISYQNQMITNNYDNVNYDLLYQDSLTHTTGSPVYNSVSNTYSILSGGTSLTTDDLLITESGTFTQFRVHVDSLNSLYTLQYSVTSPVGGFLTFTADTNLVIAPTSVFYLRINFSGVDTLYSYAFFYDQTLVIPSVTYDLDALNDVVITSPTLNDTLQYDGANWVNTALTSGNLDSLTDVIITSPTLGQVLEYDGTNWVNTASGGASTLNSLTDVDTTSEGTGDVLMKSSGDWKPSSQVVGDFTFGLTKLNDTTITSPTTGDILQYVGGVWVNSLVPLDDLSDVIITSPTTDDLLRYNGTNWVNSTVSSAIPSATETVSGIIQIATTAETTAGTDDTVALSPLKLSQYLTANPSSGFNWTLFSGDPRVDISNGSSVFTINTTGTPTDLRSTYFSNNFVSGMSVKIQSNISPLLTGDTRYVHKLSSTTFSLHTTFADAISGTSPITMLINITDTQVFFTQDVTLDVATHYVLLASGIDFSAGSFFLPAIGSLGTNKTYTYYYYNTLSYISIPAGNYASGTRFLDPSGGFITRNASNKVILTDTGAGGNNKAEVTYDSTLDCWIVTRY